MLVYDCAPKSLNTNIIKYRAFAIHADGDFLLLQILHLLLAGKLAALITGEDLRFAMLGHCFFEYLQAGCRFQRVGPSPVHRIAVPSLSRLSPSLPPPKPPFESNYWFHWEIWLGRTSKRADRAAKVSLSLSASIATWALKAAVNFLLVFFMCSTV